MKKILTGFCFTDIHNQQAMLDYPTKLRTSLIIAKDLAVKEFGQADIALVGGDNISDYPYWNKSCALPKKNFLDIKGKMHKCISESVKDGKVLYVAGNNDMILGDIGTDENEPYNTTDFYDLMDDAFGTLPETEKFAVSCKEKPDERYLGAFHYVVNGIDFIGINIHPDTAFNSHEGSYSDETLLWVKNKLNEIDPDGTKPVFVIGHLSAVYYYCCGEELTETMINGSTTLFYDMFKGHKNAFYLYGHLHGERACYRDYSSGAILHINNDDLPLDNNLKETDSCGKEYAYSLVHMGGLRPFGRQYFEEDGISGYAGEKELQYYPSTATPALAQFLVF
ncbi:MAG: metallophosphoesterase, partial [Clostridia bacterium]|nr:metallophosphoesterase [Clostridia bacterium]